MCIRDSLQTGHFKQQQNSIFQTLKNQFNPLLSLCRCHENTLVFLCSVSAWLLQLSPTSWLPKLFSQLQKTQNNAALSPQNVVMFPHICMHFTGLQSISESTTNSCSICFSFTGTGSQYLADVLKIYIPSRQIRSSSDTRLFQIPSVNTEPSGRRTFRYQGPSLWNKLSHNTGLKTELFCQRDLLLLSLLLF